MKISIRFLLYISKTNKKGECPIRCRITYNKNRKDFATGLFIKPYLWNKNEQTAEPPNEENILINKQLGLIENKIRQAFLMLQIQENNFTVNDIYTMYKGEKLAKEYNVIEYFEKFLKQLKRLIGIDLKLATWKKYENAKNHCKGFIKWKFKAKDIALKDVKSNFLNAFEFI